MTNPSRVTAAHAARAANLAAKRGYATYQDPSRESDAGRVLAAIQQTPGLPLWALARNTHLTLDRVKYACMYLKRRRKAFNHKTEYLDQKTGTERQQPCWFPGQPRTALALVDSTRCQVSIGYGRVCGTRFEDRIDRLGRVTVACPACERRNHGLCRTCPRPLPAHGSDGPRPWYCATCLAERRRHRATARCATDEYREKKAAWERARVARCKAEGRPSRSDRKAA